jgi:iron complex outermembrane receptor protein
MEHSSTKIITKLALISSLWVLSSAALAQNPQSETPPPEVGSSIEVSDDASNNLELEEVTVTGSRIKRTEFNSLAPIEIISMDNSALAGLLSVTDILQSSNLSSGTQIDDSFGGFVTDGGPGSNNVGLRGLGANRTLVLVNGKRLVSSGIGGSLYGTDLTSMPETLLDEIQIYKDGASTIYGADAVAGVINALTRESVDGGELGLTYEYPDIGDGSTLAIDGIWGKTADNWSFSVSGSYEDQESYVQADTRYAKCTTLPRLTDQDDDGVIDNQDPITGEELCFGAIYGFAASPFGWVRYDPSLGSDADSSNPNYDGLVNGTYNIPYYTRVPVSGLDNAGAFYRDSRSPNSAMVEYGNKNYRLNSQGAYDFSIGGRSATAYYEGYLSRRETTVNSGFGQFFPRVPATNPSNPFGVHGPLGEEDGGRALAVLMRWGMDAVQQVEVDRFTLFSGLKGSLSETWTYDTYIGYGRSEGSSSFVAFLSDRVAASLDAVLDDAGNLVCRDLATNPGCVAANLFTEDAMLRGQIDPAAMAYMTKRTEGITKYDKVSWSGFATGELFEMPAGAASAAFGFEWRHEAIDDQPDIDSQRGNLFGRATSGITRGSDSVVEVFGEFEAPLVSDVFLAQDITANLATRWTSYNSYGSDSTWTARLGWQIVPSVLIKGSMGTSFRAPALYEQHLQDQTGFVNGMTNDPCWGFLETVDPGAALYDNCIAEVGTDFGTVGGLPSIEVIRGGSDNLKAETSDSYTYSLVWQPEAIDLSMSVTWWDYTINDTVLSVGAATILRECYGSVGKSHPFCARVSPRNAQSELGPLDASFINIGEEKVSGYDLDFDFVHEFDRFDLAIESSFTRYQRYTQTLLGVTTEYAGRWAQPDWKGDVDVRLSRGEWTVSWRLQFIGRQEEEPVYDQGTENLDRVVAIGSRAFHNLSLTRDMGDWTSRLTVKNIFDDDPPMVGDGVGSETANRRHNTVVGVGYPLKGRSLVFNVSKNF